MRVLETVLIVLILIFQGKLWFGEGGIVELRHLKLTITNQQQENEQLEKVNQELAAEIVDLKYGLEAIEERARTELGMVKPGEVFYRVID